MVIVTGHLIVDPADRDAYLAACRDAVDQGRAAEGCLDLAARIQGAEVAEYDVAAVRPLT